jgi:hypothetical protein
VIAALSTSSSGNCINPFWSGTSKLTYVECGSKLLIFNTSTGTLAGSVAVQGTIEVFNQLTGLLYLEAGNTIYEIGT